MRPIALLNPLGDYGINQYCHELAGGLAANGVSVAFYTGSEAGLPPNIVYERYAVLTSSLLKQRDTLAAGRRSTNEDTQMSYSPLWANTATEIPVKRAVETAGKPPSRARNWFLTVELALHLKARGYGAVWTHWPDFEYYEPAFWSLCRMLGLAVVHTVHNVAPHDSEATGSGYEAIYKAAHLLVVHSTFARSEFERLWPAFARKVAIYHHGLYTIYRRCPEARERVRRQLNIRPDQKLILFCGAIRPYKNVDAALQAMADQRCGGAVLAVAGVESGFDEKHADPLGRTRALARQLGIADRVRLIPRHLSIPEMSDLFEAGDIKALPYLKGYGSGMLLLAMTFGKHIVSTKTGGAEEYLNEYPRATLLSGSDASHVADGFARAIACTDEGRSAPLIRRFQWPEIAAQSLSGLSRIRPEYGSAAVATGVGE